jgi:hypothetical protein
MSAANPHYYEHWYHHHLEETCDDIWMILGSCKAHTYPEFLWEDVISHLYDKQPLPQSILILGITLQ